MKQKYSLLLSEIFSPNIGQNGSLKCISIHVTSLPRASNITPDSWRPQSSLASFSCCFSGMRALSLLAFLSSSRGNCVFLYTTRSSPWYYLQIGYFLISVPLPCWIVPCSPLKCQLKHHAPQDSLLNPPGDVGMDSPRILCFSFLVCVTTVALKVVVSLMFIYSTWGQCPLSQ